ncbi:MAG: hypothetical protein M1838_004097 [Thelocarpon superellum]|nr:MAG: hypothetical protein M1838_004097 [Thelocarpon superellum]
MAEVETQYEDSNRAFLQAFLARGTLTFEEAKPLLAAIFSAHEGRETAPAAVTEEDFNSFVAAANDAISPFDLAIRSGRSQHDRTRIFALVNTTSDPITQLATTHSADEISYLKRLLDAMFETYNTQRQEVLAIQSMPAVRLHKAPADSSRETQNGGATQGSGGQGLSMIAAETMLQELVQEGWFEKSKAGFYSLSPRALIELKFYLVSTYNAVDEEDELEDDGGGGGERQERVKLCEACKEIVTVGQRCPNPECGCRLHNICTQGFFTVRRSEQCPRCNAEWTGRNYVGEKAITTTEAWQKGRRRSGHDNRPRAGRPSQAAVDDADGTVEED